MVLRLAGSTITAEIPPEDLALPFAEFAERYFAPAYAVVQLHRADRELSVSLKDG